LSRVMHSLHSGLSAGAYNLYITTTDASGRPSWPYGVIYSAKRLQSFARSSLVDGVVMIPEGLVRLSATQTYALVLEPVGEDRLWWWGSNSIASYPNGTAYFLETVGHRKIWRLNQRYYKDFGFRLEGVCCKEPQEPQP